MTVASPFPNVAFLEQGSAEYHRAWLCLRYADSELWCPGSPELGDAVQEHPATGETWQYLGTYQVDAVGGPAWVHEFRHRTHPKNGGQRVVVRVRATDGFRPSLAEVA